MLFIIAKNKSCRVDGFLELSLGESVRMLLQAVNLKYLIKIF